MFLIFLEGLMEINLGIDGHLNKLSSETVQLQYRLSKKKKGYSGPIDSTSFNILYDSTESK